MENDIVFLVTVPHGGCNSNTAFKRTCDRRAIEAAEMIKKTMESFYRESLYNKTLFYENETIERSDYDLNRKWSRGNPWRVELREVMQKNKKSLMLVLDVHSFPQEHFKKGCRIAILDDVPVNTNTKEFGRYASICFQKLSYAFNRDKIRPFVRLMNGITNDIQDQTQSLGIQSFLIEFAEEDYLLTETELKESCNIICDV